MNKTILLLPALTLMACATPAEKVVDHKVEEQAAIESPNQAAHAGRFAIRASDKLTEEQKTKFLNLMNKTESQVNEIRMKEGQLKAALFQDLAEGKYNQREIQIVKNRLRKLEIQKLELMFDSIEEIRVLLGGISDVDSEVMNYYRSNWESR